MSKPPISYVPGFIDYPDEVFNALWNDLSWVRHPNVPRKEYFCGAGDLPYTYGRGAGIRTYQPQFWDPIIVGIQGKVQTLATTEFEVCFLNGYEDQRDHLGWHADDSPEMDDARSIAIISLGAEREIWFCPQNDKADVTKVKLENGSLCLMHPSMQDEFYHRIPKAGFECGQRISLTFRGYSEASGE